jgi:hypothetical protein
VVGEHVGEVVKEAAALQAAGGVRGEQSGDPGLAVGGLAAEGELAVDDGASEGALGVVVGRLDSVMRGEAP